MLIAGFSLAAGASWGLAFTQGPFSLISLRFVQAAGLAVGTVGSRAMVRDTHDPLAAARILSILASTTAIAPALAPPVGGLLVDLSTWRSVFAFTGAVVSILLVWAVLALPESLPPKRRVVFAPRTLLQAYGSILASRPFLGYSCIFGFGTAAFYAFIAMAPSFFIERLHVGAGAFGLMWTGLSLSYMAGAAIAARFVRRLGAQRLLTGGVALMLGAGVSLPLLLEMIGAKALTIIGPMTILLLGQGLASPLALAGAVETRPDLAGTASGLSSSIGMAISAAVAALAGRLYDGTARPLAFSVMATTIFAALSLILLIAPADARPRTLQTRAG